MNRILIERPDGTKITIEGPDAERLAKELSPPPAQVDPLPGGAPQPWPWWGPGIYTAPQPCTVCGKYGCRETHVYITTTGSISGSAIDWVAANGATLGAALSSFDRKGLA